MPLINPWAERENKHWRDHEIIWLKAALTLLPSERFFAIRDIAALSGATADQTRSKLYRLSAEGGGCVTAPEAVAAE